MAGRTMTERAQMLRAIVQVTLKMWSAASSLHPTSELVYLQELTALLAEYKSKYGDGT